MNGRSEGGEFWQKEEGRGGGLTAGDVCNLSQLSTQPGREDSSNGRSGGKKLPAKVLPTEGGGYGWTREASFHLAD